MARFVEIHHSGTYAQRCGMAPFVDVGLEPWEKASDFTLSFYGQDGVIGAEFRLGSADIPCIDDSATGESIHIVSASNLPVLEGDDLYKGIALTRQDGAILEDFVRLGPSSCADLGVGGAAHAHRARIVPTATSQDSSGKLSTLRWETRHCTTPRAASVGPAHTGFACFTAGTLIATFDGPCPVELLTPGMQIYTRDNGPRPLRWKGQRRVRGVGDFAPIRFSPDFLESDKALFLSPQHCLLLTGWHAKHCFGDNEVLIPAAGFLQFDGVSREVCPWVTYVHLLFDQHEIVYADGVECETLLPLNVNRETWDTRSAKEIMALFPELQRQTRPWPHARQVVDAAAARSLGYV